MPSFAELMDKIGRNDPLNAQELSFLRDETRALEEIKSLVKGWVMPGTSKPIFQPALVKIFSVVLAENTASIILPIPTDYKNLIIKGSGSVTVANGGNIWAQFNGDTGNNYAWQLISGIGTGAAGALEDTTFHGVALGVFGTTGAGAGVSGSFLSEIVHYQGPWKKNVLSHTYTAEFNDLYVMGSTWANVDAIRSIEIFGTDNTLAKGTASLAAGSLIGIYGVL